ncbi:MAG: DNA-processing protein DprA [Lachnospiraceae bacterium]|nr:DNA-processing protein DprA [Lachnospiraceae bacterium]
MKYKYWLNNIEGLGNVAKRKIIELFGSAEGFYNDFERRIEEIDFLNNIQLENIKSARMENLNEKYKVFAEFGEGMVTIEDEEYPRNLLNVYDCPYGLYFLGNLPGEYDDMVAMVGARTCSSYGKLMAEEIASELAANGFVVVSGMAKGIDSASHWGCLNSGGRTIAVLGCGVDICYPAVNRNLYRRIIDNGCVISEFHHGSQPLPCQFPSRNRIISGMSNQLVVVEARKKSGSLITADFALEQGKDIYAVSGRITDSMSEGCNRLIDQGANIILSPKEFVASLTEFDLSTFVREKKPDKLDENERLIYDFIDYYPTSLEQILSDSQQDFFCVLSIINSLVDKGLIEEVFKNQYTKIN